MTPTAHPGLQHPDSISGIEAEAAEATSGAGTGLSVTHRECLGMMHGAAGSLPPTGGALLVPSFHEGDE